MTSFGRDWFYEKTYVGWKIIFESKFKHCKAIVAKSVFVFENITSLWDRDRDIWIVKCNVEIMSDGKFSFFVLNKISINCYRIESKLDSLFGGL